MRDLMPMRGGAIAILVASALLALGVAGCGDDGGGSESGSKTTATSEPAAGKQPDNGDFVVTYGEPGEGEEELATALPEAVDPFIKVLNDAFALPEDIAIEFVAGSGTGELESPFYDPQTRTITYPYSFLIASGELISSVDPEISEDRLYEAVFGSTLFFLAHEIGHALVDTLDVPVTGREEDAVDGLAAAILTQSPDTAQFIIDSADFFAGLTQTRGEEDAGIERFADEHSVDEQRYFQLLCYVYGTDPERYQALVDNGALPADRAERCPREAQQNVDSWDKLLEEYAKD
jgi:putative metallopeptidase DUF4344